MTNRASPGDWERWQDEWRHGEQADVTARALPMIARARRRLLLARLIEGAVAAALLLITAAALRHAANPFEAILGLAVGTGIGGLWVQRILVRRQEDAAATASSPRYLAVLRSVRAQEGRLARFIWLVIPMEVAFLTPWWVIGSRVHRRTLMDPGTWLTMWLPLAGMLALLWWSVRLWRRTKEEGRTIDSVGGEYRDE